MARMGYGNSSIHGSGPSFLSIGQDVLLLIIDLLSPTDLKLLRLAHSTFNNPCRYGLHRRMKLLLPTRSFDGIERRLDMLRKDDLISAVRTLEIQELGDSVHVSRQSDSSTETFTENDIRLLRRCVNEMQGLKDLLWRATNIPGQVIRDLGSNSRVRLSLTAVGTQRSTLLHRLIGSQNLYSLDIRHVYTRAEECLPVTKPLRQVLITCPNLRKLKLDIGFPKGGCVAYPLSNQYIGMGLHNGERPPALKELELVDYPFGYTPQSADYYCSGYPAHVDEEQYWIETFDWSSLRRLKTPLADFAAKLLPRLVSLEDLSLSYTAGSSKAVLDGLKQLPASLKSIEIDSIDSISWEAIAQQGPALRTLIVRAPEQYSGSWDANVLADSTLLRIRDHCHRITNLALNMSRRGDWPYETLEILADFPRLRQLELWFELGVQDSTRPKQPHVTFAAVAKLFKYVLMRKSPLQKLIVHSGGPALAGIIVFCADTSWPENNRTTFECHLLANDDEFSDGAFVTRCDDLTDEENRALSGVLRQYPDGDVTLDDTGDEVGQHWKDLGPERLKACQLAWEGPVPRQPFDLDRNPYPLLPLPDEDDPNL